MLVVVCRWLASGPLEMGWEKPASAPTPLCGGKQPISSDQKKKASVGIFQVNVKVAALINSSLERKS